MTIKYDQHIVYDSTYTYDGVMLISIGRIENDGNGNSAYELISLLSVAIGSFSNVIANENKQSSTAAKEATAGISGSLSN